MGKLYYPMSVLIVTFPEVCVYKNYTTDEEMN